MDWFVGSALILMLVSGLFTYSLYKFAEHELKKKQRQK